MSAQYILLACILLSGSISVDTIELDMAEKETNLSTSEIEDIVHLTTATSEDEEDDRGNVKKTITTQIDKCQSHILNG